MEQQRSDTTLIQSLPGIGLGAGVGLIRGAIASMWIRTQR